MKLREREADVRRLTVSFHNFSFATTWCKPCKSKMMSCFQHSKHTKTLQSAQCHIITLFVLRTVYSTVQHVSNSITAEQMVGQRL